jgi:ferric-dicitrate binding protein FerR (iron transport regulator)
MDQKLRFEQLLSDEEFQNDVLGLENSETVAPETILANYSISEKQLQTARRFFSVLSFRKNQLSAAEIDAALYRLENRITDTSVPLSIETRRRIGFLTLIVRVAAIFAIPLLLTTLYFYQQSRNVQPAYLVSASDEKATNTFYASLGARTQVILPDGSLVWLNSGSTLTCPVVFSSRSRDVSLQGEAFFEVVKNEKVPMIVTAGDLKVKVYGTMFNLNSFATEKKIEATLVEGKVALISADSKQEFPLSPGYTASYTKENRKLRISKVEDMERYTGWKEGKLLFQSERFVDIIQKLERWYNVDIKLSEVSLGDYTLHATFFDESIEQILEIFAGSIPIRIEYPKRVINKDGAYSKREILITRDKTRKSTKQ